MGGKTSEDTQKVLNVLDYWFVIEFLNQQTLKKQKDAGNRAFKYKSKIKKNLQERNKKTLLDFVQFKEQSGFDNLNSIVENNSKCTGLSYWGEFTVFLGKIKKEVCIQEIEKRINWKDMRPEEDNDEIAVASIKIARDGTYVSDSLSVSPLVWAVKKIQNGFESASVSLSVDMYNKDIKSIEKEISELFPEKEDSSEGGANKKFSAKIGYDVLLKCLQIVLNALNAGDIDANDDFVAAYYKSYENEDDIEGDETDIGLHFDCFSEDLCMVADKIRSGEISDEKLEVLTDYILGVYRYSLDKENTPERFDIVHPKNAENLYTFMVDNLTALRAPLGKWPSKFMPALMQQIAINFATDENANFTVFSVNGPPGTGKTTLLKEIIVNNIIKKAIYLAEYDAADDAFNDFYFKNGDRENHSYNKWVKRYHRLKNPRINDYSILVASSNNSAVENITKELPVEQNIIEHLKPKKIETANEQALASLADCFTVKKSEASIPHTVKDCKTIVDENGEKKSQSVEKEIAEPDIYFSYLATQLLNDEFDRKTEDVQQAFALISASLGKRDNIKKVQRDVIEPLLSIMIKNESIEKRKESFDNAKQQFLAQLKLVQELQIKQDNISRIQKELIEIKNRRRNAERNAEDKRECLKKQYENNNILIDEKNTILASLRAKKEKLEAIIKEIELKIESLKSDMQLQQNSILVIEEQIKSLESSIKGIGAIFNKSKRRRVDVDITIARDKQKIFTDALVALNGEIVEFTKERNEKYRLIMQIEKQIQVIESEIRNIQEKFAVQEQAVCNVEFSVRTIIDEEEQTENRLKRIREEYNALDSYERGFEFSREFIEDILSDDIERTTAAQVKCPWFSEQYNREREKLFLFALTVTREFILSSKKCRDNFKHLSCLWSGRYGKNGDTVRFIKDDLIACTEAAYETLFLMIPVVSSTFASIQNLFRYVKSEDIVGTLIVDEAGQACPHNAIGALYRAKKAIIVGDPKQVEPIVTDDQDLLKQAYDDDFYTIYADKSNSVQRFADIMNPYGTYLENGEGVEEWVGCPLLVHRRCISPMYDISNDISYNNMMKQQTEGPKDTEVKKFIYNHSQWINVSGKEMGRKNHFVREQGDKVVALMEVAFSKATPETPDMFIISPFNSVVNGLKDYIKLYIKNNPESTLARYSAKMESWMSTNMGTVHTVQGKEASEVIFLLGCDESSASLPAIKWVNNNIVNVAATRAKYRLYIIGDIRAWKESKCVKRAKEIIDTYAFAEIEKELSKDKPNAERISVLCNQIPGADSFPTQCSENNEEGVEYVASTSEFIAEFGNLDIMSRDLNADELKRFGFDNMTEILKYSSDIQSNLVLGIRLYLLLKKVCEKVKVKIDVSCCGILFCKAIELRMYECFSEALRQRFPGFVMRVVKQNSAGEECKIYLKDADDYDFTLGWYPVFFNKNISSLAEIMRQLDKTQYDKEWWKDFSEKLFKCKNKRNNCCHARPFGWEDLKMLLDTIFGVSDRKNDGEMKGLIFESEVGTLMKSDLIESVKEN